MLTQFDFNLASKIFFIKELVQTLFHAARYDKNRGHHFLYSFNLKISNV